MICSMHYLTPKKPKFWLKEETRSLSIIFYMCYYSCMYMCACIYAHRASLQWFIHLILSFRYLCNLVILAITSSHCLIKIAWFFWPSSYNWDLVFPLALNFSHYSAPRFFLWDTIRMDSSHSLLFSVSVSFRLFCNWNYS